MDTDQKFLSQKELKATTLTPTPTPTTSTSNKSLTDDQIKDCMNRCKMFGGEEANCKRNCGFVTVGDGKKYYSSDFVQLTKLKETQEASCVDKCKLFGGNDATCAAECASKEGKKKEYYRMMKRSSIDCDKLINIVAIASAIVIICAVGYKLCQK
jgi:hypothetical protein